ncbi:DUF305 domain-containing protein [Thermoleptolyngbya oregonensis NK1-22]|uniref:DUF305 domain-containing protein n=1 Tax=Thermoleptolyngbya oregonensis NK1-22 TaxID=2547457 RepID=A0AA96Y4S1_9CYAN|nr:DUF305 domain-containing protein [Thermoleptolyngbya oregonensis]WOB43424.1 DUF305 domain-containing protein [Thermoleptolyngbya oregonensis NK1-22]
MNLKKANVKANIQKTLLAVVFAGSLGLAACSHDSGHQNSQSTAPATMGQTMGHNMGGMDHSSMSLGPKDDSFDLRFIDGMIPHHEGAVLMAQEALEKSNRPEIRTLAEAILRAQEQEISQLQAWRKAWYPNAGDQPVMWHDSMNHMMPMTPEMRDAMRMAGDLGAADDQFDLRFIEAMIPHHEGALVMAQEALEKSDRPELRQMAEEIYASQKQEIEQMQAWRKAWYGK